MALRTLLIEDEHPAMERLTRLLKAHGDQIEILGRYYDGLTAVEEIDKQEPELIFLDIQMPELTGFEVLSQIHHQPLIIFTTAYDQYALKAFENNTVDYLLKPIDPARLAKALQKLSTFTDNNQQAFQDKMTQLLDGLELSKPKAEPMNRVRVQRGNRFRLLEPKEICWFRALDKYVEVRTLEETWLITESLATLEKNLPEDLFVRIHRSALINWNYLGELIRDDSSKFQVTMKDGEDTQLPVSRQGKARLGLS